MDHDAVATCQNAGQPITYLMCRAWHVPDGFATLLVAASTLCAGLLAIAGAVVAWRSVQLQIQSVERIENLRRMGEIASLEAGFRAELLVYAPGVLQALSIWNSRAHASPSEMPTANLPMFQEPLFYLSNINKIGLLPDEGISAVLISFYANLIELTKESREAMANIAVRRATNLSIAFRFRLMASHIVQALNILGSGRQYPLPHGFQFTRPCGPDGTYFSESEFPNVIQGALCQLAGISNPAMSRRGARA
jgi:hypothetical protein